MITEVEILIMTIPGTIETGSIIAIAEKTEIGSTEVTVGIDFILKYNDCRNYNQDSYYRSPTQDQYPS